MSKAAAPDPLFAGLISGTSMDGIDAALVRLGDRRCETIATHSHAYPGEIREALLEASRHPAGTTVDDLGRLDHAVGECFRDAAIALLDASGTMASGVTAIGSHGQTLRHLPRDRQPFTLQIGDPNVIARGTGITTVADFRRRDLAAGGEGAPLTPAFHRWLFADDTVSRVVLNIGGIANITILPAGGGPVTGFDTGPGNTLLDAWIQKERGEAYDAGGRWAESGAVSAECLERMLEDAYFERDPPKSTGFEHFDLIWLNERLVGLKLAPPAVQATLLALTVRSIADAIHAHAPNAQQILVCGGGVHNAALMAQFAESMAPIPVTTTAVHGVGPDWVEAAAFAWLASRTLRGKPGNLPSVTGARTTEVLGGIYLCAS